MTLSQTRKKTYLKYTDGDRTAHYFAEDSSREVGYYYDEDGLGLKIKEDPAGCFEISDDQGNEMYFVRRLPGHGSTTPTAMRYRFAIQKRKDSRRKFIGQAVRGIGSARSSEKITEFRNRHSDAEL